MEQEKVKLGRPARDPSLNANDVIRFSIREIDKERIREAVKIIDPNLYMTKWAIPILLKEADKIIKKYEKGRE